MCYRWTSKGSWYVNITAGFVNENAVTEENSYQPSIFPFIKKIEFFLVISCNKSTVNSLDKLYSFDRKTQQLYISYRSLWMSLSNQQRYPLSLQKNLHRKYKRCYLCSSCSWLFYWFTLLVSFIFVNISFRIFYQLVLLVLSCMLNNVHHLIGSLMQFDLT